MSDTVVGHLKLRDGEILVTTWWTPDATRQIGVARWDETTPNINYKQHILSYDENGDLCKVELRDKDHDFDNTTVLFENISQTTMEEGKSEE